MPETASQYDINHLTSAETIIIGGGAIGCGAAYALARAGKTDVLLIERAEDVGQVTTSQGAGLCGQVRDTAERIRLAMHSVSVFRELQRSDVQPDWHEVGSLRIALGQKRVEEFRQLKREADHAGLEADLIDNDEEIGLQPGMISLPFQLSKFFDALLAERNPERTDFVPIRLHVGPLQFAKDRDRMHCQPDALGRIAHLAAQPGALRRRYLADILGAFDQQNISL